MKKLLFAITMILTIFGCERDAVTTSPGKISFTFDSVKSSSDGRTNENSTPAFVLLSIKTATGIPVETDKKIPLYIFGNGFVSESIELNVGNYDLVKFIILNSDNKSIFATPVAGSSLASLVSKPLPIDFSITSNGSTQVVPEVLPITEDNTPSMFGYVEFGFKVKIPKLDKMIINQNGSYNTRGYTYDDQGLLTKIVESYCYPNLETCSEIITETLQYDQQKRITSHSWFRNGELVTKQFTYQNNLLWKILDNQGYNWDREIEFLYSENDARPTSSINRVGSGSSPLSPHTTRHTFFVPRRFPLTFTLHS